MTKNKKTKTIEIEKKVYKDEFWSEFIALVVADLVFLGLTIMGIIYSFPVTSAVYGTFFGFVLAILITHIVDENNKTTKWKKVRIRE